MPNLKLFIFTLTSFILFGINFEANAVVEIGEFKRVNDLDINEKTFVLNILNEEHDQFVETKTIPPDWKIIFAQENNNLVGFLSYMDLIAKNNEFVRVIQAVATEKSHYSQGIGTYLMRTIIDNTISRGENISIVLKYKNSNTAMIKLCEKFNFDILPHFLYAHKLGFIGQGFFQAAHDYKYPLLRGKKSNIPEFNDTYCFECMKEFEKLMICKRCRAVKFCGAECLRSSWAKNDLHRKSCKKIAEHNID